EVVAGGQPRAQIRVAGVARVVHAEARGQRQVPEAQERVGVPGGAEEDVVDARLQQRPRAERARRRLARARRLRQARQDLEGGDLEIDAGVDGGGGREL